MKKISLPILLVCGLFLLNCHTFAQSKNQKIADEAFRQYQYQLAAEYYQKAIKQSKSGSEEQNHCILRLGEINAKSRDWKQSATYFSRIAKNGYVEKKPMAMLQYASVLQYLGDRDAAANYYQKYLSQFPDDTLAQRKYEGLMASGQAGLDNNYVVTNEKILNSRDDDFGVIFLNKKRDELLLTSNRKEATGKDTDQWTGARMSDFFISKSNKNGAFQRPVTADESGILNTPANEGVPFFDDKFSTLYYTRCEKTPKTKNDSAWCVIQKTSRSGSRWTKPEIVLGNSGGNVGHPTLEKDEQAMIYAGTHTGGYGNKDLWIAQRETTRKPFEDAVNLGDEINTNGNEMFPFLLNDSTLYFASDGHGGLGGLDLFVTFKNETGEWSTPENLGAPFNSNGDDFGIVFFGNNNNSGYFCSNRTDGLGGDDIYSFKKLSFQYSLSGKIRDAATLSPIPAQPVLLVDNIDSVVVFTDKTGIYKIENENLKEETHYTLVVQKENYFSQRLPFTTAGVKGDHTWTVDIALSPIPETPIVLPEIRYELDKWDLQPQYQDSLRVLVKTLQDNPRLQIELRSHTDSRATDQYNRELSQNRAQTVVDFLIKEGIEPARLVAKGYGKTSPRVMDKDFNAGEFTIPAGTTLNDEYLNSLRKPEWKEVVHQLNRRTELVIISKNYPN